MYNRAKHIDTRIYRLREMSESREVKLDKVAAENREKNEKTAGWFQQADIFIKSQPRSSDDL